MNANNHNQFVSTTLNKDSHESLMKNNQLVYALNADISDYSNAGNIAFIQNVLSNESCYEFPNGYKFHGSIKLDKDQFVVFIGNGELSKIVLLDSNTCSSTEIISASCLNFETEIKGVYKYQNGSRRIYWVEDCKSPRFLDIDNCEIPYKRINNCQDCDDEVSNEVDCEALNLQQPINFPCISLEESTGNLPNGVYQIAIAFTDDKTRYTDYYIYPDLIKLHSNTGDTFGIELEFKDCFKNSFDQYELVLISHRTDRGTLAQRIGYFDTGQTNQLITELDETFFTPIDLNVLLSTKQYFQSADHIAINSESLIFAGLKELPKFDYRGQACSIELEWVEMLVKASEAHKYPSLMRDEVYAFDISFIHTSGAISHRTHIANLNYGSRIQNNLVPTIFDDVPDNEDNKEDGCNPIAKKYWEIYNTATVETIVDSTCNDCELQEGNSGKFAYWESRDHFYPDDYPCGLACTPIKYHKTPENCISHIHGNEQLCSDDLKNCSEPCIKILTVRVKGVSNPVDCDGNIIDFQGYVLNVSDRKNHKSVLHKGLLYNTGNEDIGCNTNSIYPNYPFNDLSEDVFITDRLLKQGNILQLNYQGLENYNRDKFTYHSPDIHYIKGQRGTEIKLYTEEVGRISGEFYPTDDHPKYQILSPLARLSAQVAGIIEANIVLNGEQCTKTITEKVCEHLVDRVTNVENFPVPITTGEPIGGGGTGLGGLVSGTGTISSNSGGEISTTIAEVDFKETMVGDPRCCDHPDADQDNCIENFVVTDAVLDDANDAILNPIGGILGDLFNDTNECILQVTTTGTVGTVIQVEIDGNTYQGYINNAGIAEINIDLEDCENAANINWADLGDPDDPLHFLFSFNPGCECAGNTTTRTTIEQEDCTARINLLEDQEWFKMIPALLYYYSEGVSATQNFLQSLIKPTDYAVQATFKADYNSYNCNNIVPGNIRRSLEKQQYLLPINQLVDEQRINNWCRANADYLELCSDILDTCETDNSRLRYQDIFCRNDVQGGENLGSCQEGTSFGYCNSDNDGNDIQAVSYYAGIKRYKPNQYGGLTNYITRTVSCVQTIGEDSDVIYAGDVYITKFSVVRKMPLFTKLPLGLPNNTDWSFQNYPNVGTPRYWMDISQESVLEDVFETLIPVLGQFFTDYNLEPINELGDCGSLIAQTNGILDIGVSLVEIIQDLIQVITDGDLDFTNPFRLQGIFYTHITGISCFYAESEFISDFREYNEVPNSNYVPNVEPSELANASNYHIPETFLYNLQYHNLGLQKQVPLEAETIDCCKDLVLNSLIYSTKNDPNSIGDNWLNFPPLNIQSFPEKDGELTGIVEIDNYNLFIAFEDAVYITQQDEGLITESGNTLYLGSPDAFQRRLRKLSADCTGYTGCIDLDSIVPTRYGVFWFDRKRKKFLNYSNSLQDLTGTMQSWFKEFLNGEIIGVYDNCSDNLYYTDKETGWTLSYKPKMQGWISHHSFIPNEYLCLSNNFASINETGIWKHNVKNEYQNYYGKMYPFEVGYVINNQFKDTTLQSLEVYSEFVEYKGYDCKIYHEKFFDELLIYNNCGSTNLNNLFIKNENSVRELSKNGISVSLVKSCTYRINEIWNQNKVQPYYCTNKDGCTYSLPAKEKIEEFPLSGKWFRVHLKSNQYNLKKILQLGLNIQDEVIR